MEKDKYLVFDTEVCNCPKIEGQLDVANGQVYDIGLQIVDKEGYIYDEYSIVNEDVFFGRSGQNDEEKESIEHCDSSDYKYKIFFASGQHHEFAQNDSINIYNAVSSI